MCVYNVPKTNFLFVIQRFIFQGLYKDKINIYKNQALKRIIILFSTIKKTRQIVSFLVPN